MNDWEEKMKAVLSDPGAMQKLQAIAQAMGQNTQQLPAGIRPEMLQRLSSLSGSLSSDEQNLLGALRPYLSSEHIRKLEKAMQAAKIASAATGFLENANSNHGR